MSGISSEVLIQIPERFAAHVAAAALRFESQYPDLRVRIEGTACRLIGAGVDFPETRSRFLHALYREKIYADGLSMRRALIETLGA